MGGRPIDDLIQVHENEFQDYTRLWLDSDCLCVEIENYGKVVIDKTTILQLAAEFVKAEKIAPDQEKWIKRFKDEGVIFPETRLSNYDKEKFLKEGSKWIKITEDFWSTDLGEIITVNKVTDKGVHYEDSSPYKDNFFCRFMPLHLKVDIQQYSDNMIVHEAVREKLASLGYSDWKVRPCKYISFGGNHKYPPGLLSYDSYDYPCYTIKPEELLGQSVLDNLLEPKSPANSEDSHNEQAIEGLTKVIDKQEKLIAGMEVTKNYKDLLVKVTQEQYEASKLERDNQIKMSKFHAQTIDELEQKIAALESKPSTIQKLAKFWREL